MNVSRLVALADAGRELLARAGAAPSGGLAWRVTAAADGPAGRRAEVYLYGAIDGWELDGSDLAREIRALDVDAIDLRVNSPGGYVFDGIAVHAALLEHPAAVTAYVDGLAASAASFIAQAGEERVMAKAARMMIHDARGVVIGDAATMREMADLLDEVSDGIADMYADRAGGDRKRWRDAMKTTTWYSAEQAVTAKLADRVAAGAPAPASNHIDLRTQRIRARARAMALKG